MFSTFIKWLFNISDRSSCFNNCLFYKKNECHMYGKGHRAAHPCDEYYCHKPCVSEALKKIEEDDLSEEV